MVVRHRIMVGRRRLSYLPKIDIRIRGAKLLRFGWAIEGSKLFEESGKIVNMWCLWRLDTAVSIGHIGHTEGSHPTLIYIKSVRMTRSCQDPLGFYRVRYKSC